MSETCELCGRAMAKRMIVPAFYPHEHVCERSHCKQAVKDAVDAIEADRDRTDPIAAEIASRYDSQTAPVGYRGDTMASLQFDEQDYWFNQVVKWDC